MKYFFLLPFFLVKLGFAQLESHTWYFSPTSKGLAFDPITDVPVVVSAHSPLSSLHGCGVASDPITGNVLFYTDGVSVYDENNILMPNGSGLSGGTSCAQKGQLALVPGSCSRFYIFCNDANDPATGNIRYSIVDMMLAGNGTPGSPKGDVEAANKNVFVTNATAEAFTLIPNPNGNQWLIVPERATDAIKIYSVTASGVFYFNTFNTGSVLSGSFAIKYSKEAGKVAYVSVVESNVSLIMDFNPVTGVFSGVSVIPGTPVGPNTSPYYGFHDVEFSPDGTKLYISKNRMSTPAGAGKIYQYDLNLPASPILPVYSIPSTDVSKNVTGMQTGPDGKIYFIYINLTYADDRLIGAITAPNLAGASCAVNAMALDLGISQGFNSRFPEFVDYSGVSVSAVNDSASLNISCQFNYGSVFIDNPSDPLSITVVGALNGSATLMPNDSIYYVSNTGFIGLDTITYLACDPACFSICDTGNIYVSVLDCATSIPEPDFANIRVYPNPASADLFVDCKEHTGLKLEIYNLLGEQLAELTLTPSVNKIDVSTLSRGLYILKIKGKAEGKILRAVLGN